MLFTDWKNNAIVPLSIKHPEIIINIRYLINDSSTYQLIPRISTVNNSFPLEATVSEHIGTQTANSIIICGEN